MTRGGRVCFFSSLRSSRLAARLSRRGCTRTSSTIPVWSTARHNQCFTPEILSTTSSRCHLSPIRGSRRRIRLANFWPNLRAHCRTVAWLDDDTASGQQLLHHTKSEGEAEIQPHGMADDLGRSEEHTSELQSR